MTNCFCFIRIFSANEEQLDDYEELVMLSKSFAFKSLEYKEVAQTLGEKKVISKDFCEVLIKMAGYRNRMVHFYKDIMAQELYDILQNEYDLVKSISQVPVILFPVSFGEEGKRSIGIRTIITNDFMTGVPAVPGKDIPEEALDKMVSKILEIDGISRVAYDLTSKPPATTEWE